MAEQRMPAWLAIKLEEIEERVENIRGRVLDGDMGIVDTEQYVLARHAEIADLEAQIKRQNMKIYSLEKQLTQRHSLESTD